jgi:catechol 2,3-dioxygenase-like lactoylglutathione lyase family enzyme
MSDPSKCYNVLSPIKLAHIVLRTAKFAAMTEYYKKFLGASVEFENDSACFLRYDDEHHRIGILKLDGLSESGATAPGLEHIAFTFASLADLLTVWKQRQDLRLEPVWCVNHGGTTSMYYEDPDGNKLESQVDNFDDPVALRAFITSEAFRANPVGTDFDPAELMARLEAGESEAVLKMRVECGPREFPRFVGQRV